MNNRFLRLLAATLCAGTLGSAGAQNNPDNLDWVEQAVPPPPNFSVDRLMPLDMPPYVSVSVGIDPQTLNVGEDGVVRYVVVMRNSSGTVNAAYEGIRCFTRDFKTYARWTSQGTWSLVSKPEWRALNDNMPSRHAMAFARQGACDGAAANSAAAIQKAMKLPQGKSKSSF